MVQQDSNQTGDLQNPEGMVEDVKEPQGGGVTEAPGNVEQQGKYTKFLADVCLSSLYVLRLTVHRCRKI